MRYVLAAIAAIAAPHPAAGQAIVVQGPVDTSAIMAAIADAKATAASALAAANTASTNAASAKAMATTAQASTANIVQSVNGVTPVNGAVTIPVYSDAQAVAANAAAVATVQSNVTSLAAITPQFVAGGAFITQAVMRATYPCAAAMLGRYARVSDTYASVASVATCETDGSTYYWRPQRADYATVSSQTSGTLTLVPFVTSPVVYLASTPTSSVSIALSTTNAWPGATFHIYAPATISLGSITITGLVGGGTLPLLQGADKIITYTSAGWKSN